MITSSTSYYTPIMSGLPSPVLGQHYANFDAPMKNVQDWAVRGKFHFEIPHRDTERVIYRCWYHDMDELGCY